MKRQSRSKANPQSTLFIQQLDMTSDEQGGRKDISGEKCNDHERVTEMINGFLTFGLS